MPSPIDPAFLRHSDLFENQPEEVLQAVLSQGRLLDFGGTYINFSDDRGKSWKQVRPQTPLVNGEGTIDLAPNGDVIAIGWDPYSGDHLQSFKYEAFSGKWWWSTKKM